MSRGDECSSFGASVDWDYFDGLKPHERFCRCPKCKGFLPQVFPIGQPFTCKKCESVLETIPNYEEAKDDDWLEDMAEDFKDLTPHEIDEEVYEHYGGKICLVPKYITPKNLSSNQTKTEKANKDE